MYDRKLYRREKSFHRSNRQKKKYLHIRNNKIIGISNGIYRFSEPVDFSVGHSNSQFYIQFFNNMMNLEDDFLIYLNTLDLDSLNFPKYLPPILSHGKIFEDYNFKNVVNVKKSKKNTKERVLYTEEEKKSLEKSLKNKLNEEEYHKVLTETTILIDTYKILKMKRFNELIVKRVEHPITILKKFLPLVALFQKRGPWSRSWINLNYKPELHFSSYRHQVITLSRKKQGYMFNRASPLDFLIGAEQKRHSKIKCK